MDDSRRAHVARWIVDRNPFYLLSAGCGLLGCWLLGDVSQPDLRDTAMKVAALVLYETAVVALAVWLAKKDATVRDAAILSMLTVTLTADAAFFSTETAMVGPTAAAGFAALGAAQALAIVGVLFKSIGVRVPPRGAWLLGLDIATVHLLPAVMRFRAQGFGHSEQVFWQAFVAIGALLAAHAWPDRWHAGADNRTSGRLPPPFVPQLASIAPAVFLTSIVAHTFASVWVFQADFFPVLLSPLLVGSSVLALRRGSIRAVGVLSIAAVLLAVLPSPQALVLVYGRSDWLAISPLRIVLVWAAAVLMGLWRIERSRGALPLSTGFLGLAVLGHTPHAMRIHFVALSVFSRRILSTLSPESREGWGVMLFAMAFLLLGVGAWTSRRRLHDVDGSNA